MNFRIGDDNMAKRTNTNANKAAEQEKPDLIKVRCIQNYFDIQQNKRITSGTEYEVTKERANQLFGLGLVALLQDK